MTSLLRGRSAFITGAASGIGHHTALSFARHGIQRLALADINADQLAQSMKASVGAKLLPASVQVLQVPMDVRDGAQVRAGLARTVEWLGEGGGRLDIAVNNAGIGGSGRRSHEVPESEFAGVLDVDLHGVWRCQREEVGISVIGLTRADGNTYGPQGIRINAIAPGYVETNLMKAIRSREFDATWLQDIENTPLKRMAMLEEIGDCITFMASPMSSYMQSSTLVVDGGFTAT